MTPDRALFPAGSAGMDENRLPALPLPNQKSSSSRISDCGRDRILSRADHCGSRFSDLTTRSVS
jgi:hypothetical protein